MTPRLQSFSGLSFSGFHRVAYWEWGPARTKRTVICVHGLTRQGRDFDFLAQALAERGWRVVCPDLPGRGRSDWLRDHRGYNLVQYGADMNALIARIGATDVMWVGSSLGGFIGMILAAQPNSPIARLVINDIGPHAPRAALRRVFDYITTPPPLFDHLEEATSYFRGILEPYGLLPEEHWRHLAEHSVRLNDATGRYEMLYDPAIAKTFYPWLFSSFSMWNYWEQVHCPTLLLRGSQSDLLLRETAERMSHSGPKATLIEFDGIGHMPHLMSSEHINPVVSFLEAN